MTESTQPARTTLLDRLAERAGVKPRTMLIGLLLPLASVAIVAATALVAPPEETSRIVLASIVAVGAGLASASVGVYGGIMVPGLLLLGLDARFVAAVTLFLQLLVIPLAAGSHYRLGNFSRAIALPLLLGGMIGAFVGPLFAAALSADVIARVVAGLIIVTGMIVLAAHRLRGLGQQRAEDDVPRARITGIGLVAGFSSGISGAGWGPLGVTMLVLSRIDPRQAIGSSLFARVFMASAAVVGFLTAQSAFHNVTPNWWIVLPLFVGSIAPMIPGVLIVSRLGRERATLVVAMLSIALALPSLLWGH